MLHPVPDSSQRRKLLRVVVLQLKLVRELCALDAGSAVDLAWLRGVWRRLDSDWIRRFWVNDTGKRAAWINVIAAASATEKQEMLEIAEEQLRFRELWSETPSVRMRRVNWNQDPYKSLNALLKCFYAPLFYRSEGYKLGHTMFHKEDFLSGIPSYQRKVCPYCDNYLQNTELDHFLPKDEFPFLSCHPDNLIPSCHDSNSGSHKGTTVPLKWGEHDQADTWFHPRLRSGTGRVKVNVAETPERTLIAEVAPVYASDAARVTNLDSTFHISEFWSNQIEYELQLIGSQVSDLLQEDKIRPTKAAVIAKLKNLALLKGSEIGRHGLAICHQAVYLFAANSPSVVADITRDCRDRLRY